MSAQQVFVYVALDFEGEWKRTILPDAIFQYQPNNEARKLRVIIDVSGGHRTFLFSVPHNDYVYVYSNIVHVPGRCQERSNEFEVRCGD